MTATKTARIESPIGCLTAGKLKIIACISMFIDHLGLMIFPNVFLLRALGRLAFPIFAYFIAEGCHYSKRKVRRFLLLFIPGIVFFIFYYLFTALLSNGKGDLYGSIFLTFSISVLIIYALDYAKKLAFSDFKWYKPLLVLGIVTGSVGGAYLFCSFVEVDYGFFGVMVPVLVSLFDFRDLDVPDWFKYLDNCYVRIAMLALGIFLVYLDPFMIVVNVFGIQVPYYYFSYLIIPLMLLYNGKVGNKKMKYGFYIFYPAHLALIGIIYFVMILFQ